MPMMPLMCLILNLRLYHRALNCTFGDFGDRLVGSCFVHK